MHWQVITIIQPNGSEVANTVDIGSFLRSLCEGKPAVGPLGTVHLHNSRVGWNQVFARLSIMVPSQTPAVNQDATGKPTRK